MQVQEGLCEALQVQKAALECTALCVCVRAGVLACVRACVKGSTHINEFLATEENCNSNPGEQNSDCDI